MNKRTGIFRGGGGRHFEVHDHKHWSFQTNKWITSRPFTYGGKRPYEHVLPLAFRL